MNTLTGQLQRSSTEKTVGSEAWYYDGSPEQEASTELLTEPPYTDCVRILGEDFISPESIADARGLVYDEGQLTRLAISVPSESTLQWCQEKEMILVAGPPTPMSVVSIRQNRPHLFYKERGSWYDKSTETFSTRDLVGPCWLALNKDMVFVSDGKPWQNQKVLVKSPCIVPNIAEVVWCITTLALINKVRLGMFVRTSSTDSAGDHVIADASPRGGVHLAQLRNDIASSALGIIAARRF